jgi:hypothetical protein
MTDEDHSTILRTLGVRSACRNTVTFALRTHVGASCEGVCVAGSGLSIEDDTLIHNAANISAALSAASRLVLCYEYELIPTVVCLVTLHETPSVYIDDLTFATVVASKHVKATYTLAKAFGYLISPRFLFFRKPGDESELLLSPCRKQRDGLFTGSLSLLYSVGRLHRSRATSVFPHAYIPVRLCRL